jgi:hypothetical protein
MLLRFIEGDATFQMRPGRSQIAQKEEARPYGPVRLQEQGRLLVVLG